MRPSNYMFHLLSMLALFLVISAVCFILIGLGYDAGPGLWAVVALPPFIFLMLIIVDAARKLHPLRRPHSLSRHEVKSP